MAKANRFKKAAQTAAKEVKSSKKKKGTIIELPVQLDNEQKLTGESQRLDQAIHDLIDASAEEKAAKNKAGIAKSVLTRFAHPEVARLMAAERGMPATPIKIVSHQGNEATYVVTDKSNQYALKPDAIEELQELLGEDGAANVVLEREEFKFNPKVMNEPIKGQPDRCVGDVIFEVVDKLLDENAELSERQKDELIVSDNVTRLVHGAHEKAAEFCGQDASRIEEFLDICRTQLVRYIKA